MRPLYPSLLCAAAGAMLVNFVPALNGSQLTERQRDILRCFELVELPDGQGGTQRALRIERCNLQIVNGRGATDAAPNGMGNLILGYHEPGSTADDTSRTGSHNLVIGKAHAYSSHSGIVAGTDNASHAPGAIVLGGDQSRSTGVGSVIVGGTRNRASGPGAAVVGGARNRSTSTDSVVAGGIGNQADSLHAAVLGGDNNRITGNVAGVIVGGESNRLLDGDAATIAGGTTNRATGGYSFVGGGFGNLAEDIGTCLGGATNTAHSVSCVVGGHDNVAGTPMGSGVFSTVTGGELNTATGVGSAISGGLGRQATGEYDWVAGSLFEDQ